MQAKVELGHDGKDERKCGSAGTGRRRQVSSVFNFLGPLIQADDTRLFSLGYSRRSESSDPGGVAGATLVKIAIFSVNPVTKTGPPSTQFYLFLDVCRAEDVHDAHVTLALPPHHRSYNSGDI